MGEMVEGLLGFIAAMAVRIYKMLIKTELTEEEEERVKKIKRIHVFAGNVFFLFIAIVSFFYFGRELYLKFEPWIDMGPRALGLARFGIDRLPPQVGMILFILIFAIYIGAVALFLWIAQLITFYELAKFWVFIEIINMAFGYPLWSDHHHSPLILEMLHKLI
jgi:hypothetical protein